MQNSICWTSSARYIYLALDVQLLLFYIGEGSSYPNDQPRFPAVTEFRLPPFETAKLLVKEQVRSSGRTVFSLSALRRIVDAAMTPWPYSTTRPRSGQVIEDLITEKAIRHLILESPEYPAISRYAYGTISMLELATSLRSRAYISHWSAVGAHGLGTQPSPTIYVNHEQSPKPQPKGPLLQEGIDRAFARPQRQSNYVFKLDAQSFTILSGKNTQDCGVATMTISGRDIRVTNISRTLIDIAVRPAYAGGVMHVAEVFKAAAHKLKINTLLETLQAIGHKYPFHQALGYYLTMAGVPPSQLVPLKEIGIHHKFYLDYGTTDAYFDDTWAVYVPVELNAAFNN